MDSGAVWSVERHLADKPDDIVDLYHRFVRLLAACGQYEVSVTKTAIAFKGSRRGFEGAKPRKTSPDGFLDLQRAADNGRFLRVRRTRRHCSPTSTGLRHRRSSTRHLPDGLKRHIKSAKGPTLQLSSRGTREAQ